jgi:hypothetical protein
MAWTDWSQRSAYLFVRSDWKTGEAVWKKAQGWPQTIGAWMVTGGWGILIWLDSPSIQDLYEKVVEVRSMKGVSATSTHFVYKGMKNGKWWWEWPAGAWVFLRSPHLNGEMKGLKKWKWVSSAASIPGDWDYLMWAGGSDWGQVWNEVAEMNKAGWQSETLVPLKSWWNKDWQNRWWSGKEGQACGCCG